MPGYLSVNIRRYTTMSNKAIKFLLLLWAMVHCSPVFASADEDSNGEVENDADAERPPLLFYAEIEVEKSKHTTRLIGENDEVEQDGPIISGNFIFDYLLNETSILLLDYEVDVDEGLHGQVEELYLATDLESWALKLGRQAIPFGQPDSEFINESVLEFAEFNKTAVLTSFDLGAGFTLAGYAFDSSVDTRDDDHQLDGGALVSYSLENESLYFGLGYMSDLAEVRDSLGDIDRNTVLPRTAGLDLQLFYAYADWGLIMGHVEALDSVTLLEKPFNKPSATTLEVFYQPGNHWLLAGRIEHSRELEDFPERQHSILVRYAVDQHLSFGLEYQSSQFDAGHSNDDDIEIDNVSVISLEVSIDLQSFR